MKKKLCVLLTLIFTLCLLFNSSLTYAGTTTYDLNDDIKAEVTNDGVLTFTGHGNFKTETVEEFNTKKDSDLDITEIYFKGDSNKIIIRDDASGLFNFTNFPCLEKFVCNENSNVDTRNCTKMDQMFCGNVYLTHLDVSGFVTSKVTSMVNMFEGCEALSILNLSSFNTSSVEDYTGIFQNLDSLEELIIPNFNIKESAKETFEGISAFGGEENHVKVIDFRYADLSYLDSEFFSWCDELEKVYLPNSVPTSYVVPLNFGDGYIFDKSGYIGTKDNPMIATILLDNKTKVNNKVPYYITCNKPDSVRVLSSISATKTKTTYQTNESINYNDITVVARYDNGTKRNVTNYTYQLENSNTIKITYTEDGVTKGESIRLTFVAPKVVLSSISVTKDKKDYLRDELVSYTDIKINATYSDGHVVKDIPYNDPNVTISVSDLGKDILNIKYTDPNDSSIYKSQELLLTIEGVDTLRYISAKKDEDEYDTYSDVELDDITCYAYYTRSGRVKLSEITLEEYNSTKEDRPDGYCVFYDPDDEDDEIVVKYKDKNNNYKVYTDTISLDIDEDDDDEDDNRYLDHIVAYKDKTSYYEDEKVDYDDIYIKVYYVSSSKKNETIDYTDNDKNMKVSINGSKTKITVKYTYKGETCSDTINIKYYDGKNPNNTIVVQGNKQVVLYIGSSLCYINGVSRSLDAAPEIKNDRTYLPIRHVVEALGGEVTWSSTNASTVQISKDNIYIVLNIGSKYAYVNGVTYTLDDAPYTKNDRTYMPVRFISEHLGAIVDWSASNPYQVVVRNR